MDYTVLESDLISVPFTRTNGQYTLQDALVLPRSEFEALSETDLLKMQDDRFAAWVAFLIEASNAPPRE